MPRFGFDEYARATLGGARKIGDGSPLSELQKQDIQMRAASMG